MADDNANETKNEPVTIGTPAAAVTVDPQNPLPEGSFMWRRIFAAVIGANALVFAWFAARWFHDGAQWEHLYGLTMTMIYGAGLILTYYFVAPSASELTNMLATAGVLKHSLTTAAQTASQAVSGAQPARFATFPAPDSQIPLSAPGEAPRGLDGDLENPAEIDAAPRGQP